MSNLVDFAKEELKAIGGQAETALFRYSFRTMFRKNPNELLSRRKINCRR